MQSLFAFLRRFSSFLWFLLLQVICFTVYNSFVTYPQSHFINLTNSVNGTFYSIENQTFNYFSLLDINKDLLEENAKLRGVAFDQYYQIQRPTFFKQDTLYKQSFKYIPATIINSTTERRNNYFLINVGGEQQIKQGMGVISNKGVVGIVFTVGNRFSLVKSVLTSDINIDVTIGKTKVPGILKWNGLNPKIGSLFGVSSDINVKVGNEVKTRGATGIFPKGILIGKINKIRQMENQSLWDIDMLYQEDFRTVRFVYVIQSLIADEIQQLQFSIPHSNPE